MQEPNDRAEAMRRMQKRIRPVASADAPKERDHRVIDWTLVDWDDLVPRLLLLAMSRLSRMTWRGQRDSIAPGAAEAEDFVNDAIAKTMDGVRVWSEETCSLFQHLAGIVVSDVSHAATAAENRLTLADDGRQDARIGGWPPDRADETPDQEQVALWRSEQRRLLDHLSEIDPVMGEMAALILIEDIDQTSELTLRLDLAPSEIANLRKRIRRATNAYLLADQGGDREVSA